MTPAYRIQVSLTPRQLAYVERVREQTGASAAEIIRRLLDKALAKVKP